MNKINAELAAQIVKRGLTQKQLAVEMEMAYQTFKKKMTHRKQSSVNLNAAHFSPAEKVWLAKRLNMDARLIK